jgi:hypothetical protein|uniref:Uncharacterized protein n=1 Tax=viral metagenome TaxID=1070528 RepID=A0A6C0LIM3_9ZZZZ
MTVISNIIEKKMIIYLYKIKQQNAPQPQGHTTTNE